MSFKTPDGWLKRPGVRPRYDGLVFDRNLKDREARARILGVGHVLLELALSEARALRGTLAAIPRASLPHPVVVFRIRDRVTGEERAVRFVVCAVQLGEPTTLVLDWQLLDRLNRMRPHREEAAPPPGAPARETEPV